MQGPTVTSSRRGGGYGSRDFLFFPAEHVKAIETEVPHIVHALEELSTNSRTRSTSALILAEISK